MVETVFENRFQHLEEMRRMGLHSEIIRDTARIVWGQVLQGRSSIQRIFLRAALIWQVWWRKKEKQLSVS